MALSNAERQARWRARHPLTDKARIAELEAEVAKLKGSTPTVSQLASSAQKKIDAELAREKRRLQHEFEHAVQAELANALNETVLPQYNKEMAQARQIIESRKGVMPCKTYVLILSCLHPDRVTDLVQKELYVKAFHAFSDYELVLCSEKEMPTASTAVPRTYEEMVKRRAEVKTKRQRQRNSLKPR